MIINKVAIAKFLNTRGIPAGEAIFAAVILSGQGIDVDGVKDAFDVMITEPEHFDAVSEALEEARDRAAARKAVVA